MAISNGSQRSRAIDPANWTADQIAQDKTWLFSLSSEEATAVRDVIFKHAGRNLEGLTHDDFDFGIAEGVLTRAAYEVDAGKGLAVIRGLDLSDLKPESIEAGFYGVGTRFGTMRTQNAKGDLVSQIKNQGFDFADPASRGYTTRDELRPHSDGCDILALLCVRKAKSGGENSIVSSLAVHDAILERHPELVETLYRGFFNDLRSEKLPDGQSGVSRNRWPVFVRHEDLVSCGFNPKSIRNAPLKMGKPLESIEEEAIAALERLAASQEFSLELTLEPGDLLFVNNLTTLHSRTAFEDDDEPHQSRLLLRLWISSYRPRPLPEEVARVVRGGFVAQVAV